MLTEWFNDQESALPESIFAVSGLFHFKNKSISLKNFGGTWKFPISAPLYYVCLLLLYQLNYRDYVHIALG